MNGHYEIKWSAEALRNKKIIKIVILGGINHGKRD